MAKVKIKLEILPGGGVVVQGVTDTRGANLPAEKCRNTAKKVGSHFGKENVASNKSLPSKTKVSEDIHLG